MDKDIEYKILNGENDIIKYEKSIFQAYSEKNPDGWLVHNFELVDGNRYKSTYKYKDQLIYAGLKNSEVICAAAININIDRLLIEEIGYKIPPEEKQKNICEGITFHMIKVHGIGIFEIFHSISKFMNDDLKKRGYRVLYGSCEEKLIRLYLLGGFEVVSQIVYENQPEYILRKNIT